MVALTSAVKQLGSGGPFHRDDNAAFNVQAADMTPPAAADDTSSSQSSGGATVESVQAAPEAARRKVSFGATEDIEAQPHDAYGVVAAGIQAAACATPVLAKVFCV